MIAASRQAESERVTRAFFIDSENGVFSLIEGAECLNRSDKVFMFHRDNVPRNARLSIEMCPATVEWIACVDSGVKNSMDVQIVAELSAQLQANEFENAFIVSNDKGYLPALHYLERTTRGVGHSLALVSSITRAVALGSEELFRAMRTENGRDELERAFALAMGVKGAADTLDNLRSLLAQETERPSEAIAPDDSLLEEIDSSASEDVVAAEADSSAFTSDAVAEGDSAENANVAAEEADASFKETPGIGRALSAKLRAVGIEEPSQLAKLGALEAWRRIHQMDGAFPIKWIYAFDAAVQGVPLYQLDAERKKELRRAVRECAALQSA